MRRSKKSMRGDVLIDLTSLLDVIFIVLLVVLCEQNIISQNLNESRVSIENEQEQLEATAKLYNDMLDTADNLNSYVWAASISVPYDRAELTKREIKILVEGKEIVSFQLVGNEVDQSLEQFRQYLVDYIVSHEERPVILSLNEMDENILYRDEVAINYIFSDLAKEYGNVYIKGNISEE